MDLNDAFYFVQVVEKGGFSAASRALNIPKSRVSRRVQQLENDLDQTQEKLMNANQRLEEKEKALQNVSLIPPLFTS